MDSVVDKVGMVDKDRTGSMGKMGKSENRVLSVLVLASGNNMVVVPQLHPPGSHIRLMARTLLQAGNFAPPK